jgi:tryptophanyl-tRNA synthetase
MKKRILTGDTPTGKLHLGHFVGTLENRVKLQNDYETFIIEADLHSLTTLSKTPNLVPEYTRQVVLDNISAGLDPSKVTFFIESTVPEIYELAAFFSMYVSHNRALRNPTIKDEITMKGLGDQFSLGFVNYPIYQAADILCVKGELVPVGVDQRAHLEQTREIARDLNSLAGKEIFPIPEALVGRVGRLPGTDGEAKMSKSLGNVIYLSDNVDAVTERVKKMFTDPTRLHPNDPGHVEGNPVFIYHRAFNKNQAEVDELEALYKQGKVGDVVVKEKLASALNEFLEPIRARRAQYEAKGKKYLDEVIFEGTKKARSLAGETLETVKEAIGMGYFNGMVR